MMQDAVKSAGDERVRADDLASKHKGRRNKEERMASVLEGVYRLRTGHLASYIADSIALASSTASALKESLVSNCQTVKSICNNSYCQEASKH